LALLLTMLLGGIPAPAQQPVDPSQPPAPPASATPGQKKEEGYKIKRDVDLVVLHATVVDQEGRFVPDLKADSFRVFEDKVEQKLAICRRQDIPLTMGLVIDNSGSMRDKRSKVNAAALTLVQTSNPQDEVFVVNFNEDYYLDLDKDFTSDIGELKEALERIDSRGSTALFDAVVGSLDHLKKGTRDKKALLVVTDGEDNASRKSFEYTVRAAQQSDAAIYAIGLLSQEDKGAARRSKKALTTLAESTGGVAYFPKDVESVQAICTQIAHDIRNQYLLAYYPTNGRKDGTFRTVQVQVVPPRGHGKMFVRTRTGYYAQQASASD
jgi:Ca-activated chloride channel family protein